MSPDNHWQMLRHGLDMFDIEHLLITHSHEDHFALSMFTDKTMAKDTNEKPISIYLSRPAHRFYVGTLAARVMPDWEQKRYARDLRLIELENFQSYEIGGLAVETVKGNHLGFGPGEASINYLITPPEGDTLLYALDTGYYRDETWEFLSGRHTDVLVMDCTFAGRSDRGEYPDGHLDIASFLKMLDRMTEIGFLDSGSQVYATHFNPHQGRSHGQIQEAFDGSPHRVTVAHDGMTFTI